MGLRHVSALQSSIAPLWIRTPGAPARGGDVVAAWKTLEALRSWWWPRRSPTTCVKSELHDRPDVEGPRVQIEEFGNPRSINSRSWRCGSEESSTPPGSARAPSIDRRGLCVHSRRSVLEAGRSSAYCPIGSAGRCQPRPHRGRGAGLQGRAAGGGPPKSGLVEFPLSSVSYMELLQQQDTDRRESVGRVMPSPRR
jgi:hypothetical protein